MKVPEISEAFKRKVEKEALEACVVPDSNGEPYQDEWGYDRFKIGAYFAHPLAFTEGVRAAVDELKEGHDEILKFEYILAADWLLSHFGIE